MPNTGWILPNKVEAANIFSCDDFGHTSNVLTLSLWENLQELKDPASNLKTQTDLPPRPPSPSLPPDTQSIIATDFDLSAIGNNKVVRGIEVRISGKAASIHTIFASSVRLTRNGRRPMLRGADKGTAAKLLEVDFSNLPFGSNKDIWKIRKLNSTGDLVGSTIKDPNFGVIFRLTNQQAPVYVDVRLKAIWIRVTYDA